MKLNLLLIIGLSILISYNTNGQDNKTIQNKNEAVVNPSRDNDLKTEFTTDMSNYLKAFNEGDWDRVINMIYPKLFDLLTKEQIKQTFKQMEEIGMEIKTYFNKIENISKVINFEKSKFCRIFYNGSLTIKISGVMLESKDQLGRIFIDSYGIGNVKYDDINNSFDINTTESMIAISKLDSREWKYLEYDAQQIELLKQLIPEKVLEQIAN